MSDSPPRRGSTQSYYLKYRPQSFDSIDLVGQEHVVRTLRNAIAQNRVAHAYLFCGPRGTGKTTTARLLAKAVNCLDPDPMARPCNHCAACDAINNGSAPDVIEIDAASNRGIDDIRDLRDRARYAPAQLQTKFYIIDEAHQITGPAANAFLKTLEEPPPFTKFILATTDPEELLPTIVSRCQRFDFKRIDNASMMARLTTVAEREELQVEPDALQAIARNSTGSLRDALGLLDLVASYAEESSGGGTSISAADVDRVIGVGHDQLIEELASAVAAAEPGKALTALDSAIENGAEPRQINRQLLQYWRTLMHCRAGGECGPGETTRQIAGQFSLGTLVAIARIFSETDFRIRHTIIPQMPLEMSLVEAALAQENAVAANGDQRDPTPQRAPQTPVPGKPVERQRQEPRPASTTLRDAVRGQRTDITPPPPATTGGREVTEQPTGAATGELTIEQLVDIWPRVRANVKSRNRRVEALMQSTDPSAIVESEVILVAEFPFHRDRLNEQSERELIGSAITTLVGQRFTVRTVLRGEEGAVAASVTHSRTTDPARQPISSGSVAVAGATLDPGDLQVIEAAINLFDARVEPTSN